MALRTPLAAILAALALAAAAPAAASPVQESIVMDDAQVVYVTPERLDATFAELKRIGADRVRVSVYWHLVAPAATSRERPFSPEAARSPASYEPAAWDRYDAIVRLARKHGLGLLFSITGPAPLWATGRPERRDLEDTYAPSPPDLRDFVTALGVRYSGGYRDEVPGPPPRRGPLDGVQEEEPPPRGDVLPRVDFWSVWNEPNHPGWLTPQWLPDPRSQSLPPVPVAAAIYRMLVDAAYAGLDASGHGGDTVLIGETAPRGHRRRDVTGAIRPLEFVREMYCLDRRFRPYRGGDASARGCPGSRAAFASAHPALFRASGWAHHPYARQAHPARSDRHRDHVVLADTRRLTRTLDRIFSAHGSTRRLPIWMTEYGYQTNPPDPTSRLSWSRQAAWLNEGDWIAYRDPRIASSAQFLLLDDAPRRELAEGDRRRWGTFQTGLKTAEGTPKRAYLAYQRPIHVEPARTPRGRIVRLFGQLRSAPDGVALSARLQFRPRGSRRWRTVRRVSTSNPRGFVTARLRARRSGWYRLVWRDPATGRALPSRRVRVTVRSGRLP